MWLTRSTVADIWVCGGGLFLNYLNRMKLPYCPRFSSVFSLIIWEFRADYNFGNFNWIFNSYLVIVISPNTFFSKKKSQKCLLHNLKHIKVICIEVNPIFKNISINRLANLKKQRKKLSAGYKMVRNIYA